MGLMRASELSLQQKPARPAPYFKRRLAELVAEGKAVIRKPGKVEPREMRMWRTATRLSWVFSARLAVMQDVRVYYSPSGYKLAFRRQNPRAALNGKVYIPKLPQDAEFVGRYSYPHSRRQFVRDLLEVMGGRAHASIGPANLSAEHPPTIQIASVREGTSVRCRTQERGRR